MKKSITELKSILFIGGNIIVKSDDYTVSELKNLAFTAKSKKASILIKNASILTVYECKSIAFINPNYVTFDFS